MIWSQLSHTKLHVLEGGIRPTRQEAKITETTEGYVIVTIQCFLKSVTRALVCGTCAWEPVVEWFLKEIPLINRAKSFNLIKQMFNIKFSSPEKKKKSTWTS